MNDLAIDRLQRVLSCGWTGPAPDSGHATLVGAPAAIWTDCPLSLNVKGTIVWAGPATREVLGWSPEDLAGSHFSVLTSRLGRDFLEAHLALILGGGGVTSLVDVGVKRDGRTFKAAITLEALRTGRGDVTGATVVLRDVTAAHRQRRTRELGRQAGQAVVVADADFTVHHATEAVSRMLGYAPGEALGGTAEQLIHPADHAAVTAMVERLRADPGSTERLVARLRDKQERWRWVEGTVTNRLADPEVRGLVADLRDVTEQVRSRDALRLSGALHQAMVETAEAGIAVVAPDGSTRYANSSLAGLLGLSLEQLYATPTAALLGTAPDGTTTPRRDEVVHAHPDGSDRLLEVTRSPLDLGEDVGSGAVGSGSLLTVVDVTEVRREERALRRRALYDPLTGLPNRYLFLDRLEMAAARQARTEGAGTAVLFLDLDRFKPVNDGHGHHVGDALLQAVAARLAGAVRATDTVARHGGDEFVIICEDIDEAAARSVASRIQAAFDTPIRLGQDHFPVSISVGVALSPPYAIDELVRQADAAMYHAKQQGGGRSAVAHQDGAVVVHPQDAPVPAVAQPPLPREGEPPTS
ncbi:hypothetical protein GCM10009844_12660 [Nocardioides koreensis]|uniref:Diguanylate cyclase n=1 Tax=Nocardioides koreensis TaxID=433651 RepID=A0ABP5L526_9ACTN